MSCALETSGLEVYRFSWYRSFHRFWVFRVEKTNDAALLIVTETDGRGGDEPGPPRRRFARVISTEEWKVFESALAEAAFWKLPTLPQSQEIEVAFDGADWVVEGVQDGRYHIVSRHGPEGGFRPHPKTGKCALLAFSVNTGSSSKFK